jgi:hypothetical protein
MIVITHLILNIIIFEIINIIYNDNQSVTFGAFYVTTLLILIILKKNCFFASLNF